MKKTISVLVVDDSAFMRKALVQMIETSPDIHVCGTAINGQEAIELAQTLRPDVITMDVEMPVMNGIDATKQILSLCPTPIIMISTLTAEGAQVTLDALMVGAIDFILKRSAYDAKEIISMRDEIIMKIVALSRNSGIRNESIRQSIVRQQVAHSQNKPIVRTVQQSSKRDLLYIPNTGSQRNTALQSPALTSSFKSTVKAVVIGISTGGPLTLQKVIPQIPSSIPVPIFLVQHMPPRFTLTLAERLNASSAVSVVEAHDGQPISSGYVYIAPGGKQMTITKEHVISISDKPLDILYKPSVDVTAQSVIDVYGAKNILGIMMTGMGRDGSETFKKIHNEGGYIIAQNTESCIVNGMPQAVVDCDAANEVCSIEAIISKFQYLCTHSANSKRLGLNHTIA